MDMGYERGIKFDAGVFGLSNCKKVVLNLNREIWGQVRFWEASNQEFTFGHEGFDVQWRSQVGSQI